MLPFHRRHRWRDGAGAAGIHDHDVGALGRRLRQSGEIRSARPSRAHAAGAQELLQVTIERIDDENFGNEWCGHHGSLIEPAELAA